MFCGKLKKLSPSVSAYFISGLMLFSLTLKQTGILQTQLHVFLHIEEKTITKHTNIDRVFTNKVMNIIF